MTSAMLIIAAVLNVAPPSEGEAFDFTAVRDKAHVCDGHVVFTRGPVLPACETRFGDGPIDENIRGY